MILSSTLSACLFFLLILAPISRPALLLPTMIHHHPLGSWLDSGCQRGRTAFVPPSFGLAHLLDMARSSTVPPRSLCSLDGLKRTAAAQQYGQRYMVVKWSQGCTSARGRGGLLLGMVTGASDSGDGDEKDDAMDQNAMDVLREVTFDEATIVGKLMRTLNPQLFVPSADSASAAPGQLDGAPPGEGASNASSDPGGSMPVATPPKKRGDLGIETLLPPPQRPNRNIPTGRDSYNSGGVGVGVMNALGGLTGLLETSLQLMPTQLPRRLIQVKTVPPRSLP